MLFSPLPSGLAHEFLQAGAAGFTPQGPDPTQGLQLPPLYYRCSFKSSQKLRLWQKAGVHLEKAIC